MSLECPCCGSIVDARGVPFTDVRAFSQHKRGLKCITALLIREGIRQAVENAHVFGDGKFQFGLTGEQQDQVRIASRLLQEVGFDDRPRAQAVLSLLDAPEKMAAFLSIEILITRTFPVRRRHAVVCSYLLSAGVLK